MTIEEVRKLLLELGFPPSFISDQTALTILALADRKSRAGLLPGHACLADGARIHDILEFVRTDFERRVAENTRELYRKTSLRPLLDAGWVIRHRLSTNDPNTHYRLHGELAELLAAGEGPERDRLSGKLRIAGKKIRRKEGREGAVLVRLAEDRQVSLSPGLHNELERAVVETLAPAILTHPTVVYLGDTTARAGHQDRALLRRLNLPIDVTEALPDVVIYSVEDNRLLVVEAVASTGPIDETRLEQLRALCRGPAQLGVSIELVTAFPGRKELRKFVEEIAWGTSVWVADEPWTLIHFVPLDRAGHRRSAR